tara:strand:+ start:53 stop:1039 length:987 start_codon:yes stop_codon:yes gene_type:complete
MKNKGKYRFNLILILKNNLIIYLRRIISWLPDSIKNTHYNIALKKYDKRAGSYVKIYRESLKENIKVDGIIEGKPKRVFLKEAYHKHLNWLSLEIKKIVTSNVSILEVGAGELTTLVPLAKLINEKTLRIHASELSWSRCRVGIDFAKSEGFNLDSLTVASVTALPYPDNCFDIVYTHCCLEELGGFEKEALNELMRVCNRDLILIEASYELGSKEQRRKLFNRRWNINLLSAAKSLGHKLIKHELTPYWVDQGHHASIIHIRKKTNSEKVPFRLICPESKENLKKDNTLYFCESSGMVYPIIQGIPIFLENNGIIASKYLDFKNESA